MSFEVNAGQVDNPNVQFLTRGSGYTMFLGSTEATLVLARPTETSETATDVVGVHFIGAQHVEGVGLDRLPGVVNYFQGNDPSQWHTGISTFGTVAYRNIYDGIDLVYHGTSASPRQLEYDWVVAPGANPDAIRLAFQGADQITLDDQGNLHLQTAGGDVVMHAPVPYQEIDGVRQAVDGRYVLLANNQVGFQIGAYDASRPLIIDPVLSYSTYLGGSSADTARGLAVDAEGNAYIVGETLSTDFPSTSSSPRPGGRNAFVTKLNATGSAIVYSTYLGGSLNELGVTRRPRISNRLTP